MDNVTADTGLVKLDGNNGGEEIQIKIGLNNYKGVEVISGLNEADVVVYDRE